MILFLKASLFSVFTSFADDICDYFGVKIGMYFAWLGFYTNSMLYPAVIGFLLWILAEADQVQETYSITTLLMLLSHIIFYLLCTYYFYIRNIRILLRSGFIFIA